MTYLFPDLAPQKRFTGAELIVDSFAGGGGTSTGIEMALGRSPDIAINHSPEAVAMHAANHPLAAHLCQNIWQADPVDVAAGRPIGLAWFSPDCFVAGTMILTDSGYRPIEHVREGDMVLTHAGRYRRVYATMQADKPVVTVSVQGVPSIQTTAEHPFYTRAASNVWDNEHRRYRRELGAERWTEAANLRTIGAPMNARSGDLDFCATPCEFPAAQIPQVNGRGMTIDARLLWLAGRYVGDGWSRLTDNRAELVITCGKHEADSLVDLLNVWPRTGDRAQYDELAWSRRDTATAHQFATNHRGLVEWLRDQFGHGAEKKLVPAWLLGACVEFRTAFLDGYRSADGCELRVCGVDIRETITVSRALAFSIKALVESLGHTAQVSEPRANSNIILGRTVNSRDSYMVRWRPTPARSQTVRDGIHNWSRVQSVSEAGLRRTVYNISVEDDESYVADGLVVHNCKHFSKAKGGKPVEKSIRDLAWVVVHWAKRVRPRVIFLENVEEFQGWCPLDDDGQPDFTRKGETFKQWVAELRRLGYRVEWKELRACDYGAPTIRKRLFVIARCDGQPIAWPEPTHGRAGSGLLPYRTAAEIIDWSIPCPSIFDRKRPLAEATLNRIAAGLRRFVFESARPFIVPVTHAGDNRCHDIDGPLRTITTAQRGEFALVTPHISRQFGASVGHAADEPLATTTAGGSGKSALITAVLAGCGGRAGQSAPRSAESPMATMTAKADQILVQAFLAKHYGGVVGHELDRPIGTVTTSDHHSLVTSHLIKLRGTCKDGQPVDEPAPTITAGGTHIGEVRAFLIKYFGAAQHGQPIDEPLHTVTALPRFGLVTVAGEDYQILDIGMRMLTPRELFRAQGFPEDFRIEIEVNGRPLSKAAQVRCCGNSVSPPVAAALVKANYTPAMVELEAAE